MKIYNLSEIKGESGDSYVKDAVLIYGDPDNIWEGKTLEICTKNSDAVLVHLKPQEEIKAHHHGKSEEFVLITKGAGKMSEARPEGREEKEVKEGDFVFLEAGIRHDFKAGEKGMSCLCIHAPGMHFRG